MGVSRQEGSVYMDDASERAIEEDMLDQFNYFDDEDEELIDRREPAPLDSFDLVDEEADEVEGESVEPPQPSRLDSLLSRAPMHHGVRAGLYRAGVDVEADEGGSIEHGSPFHECGVAAAAELDTHHCRPNPRSFMQQGLSMFLCPAHIVSAGSWGHSLAIDALERSDIQFFDSVCIYARYWVIKSKSEYSRSAMRLGQPGRFCGRG